MSEITEEDMKAARACWLLMSGSADVDRIVAHIAAALARARLAGAEEEREACARMAEYHIVEITVEGEDRPRSSPENRTARSIAAAIRARAEVE